MTSAVPQIIVISCFLFWRACRKSQQEADAAERELVDGPMVSSLVVNYFVFGQILSNYIKVNLCNDFNFCLFSILLGFLLLCIDKPLR